MKQLSDYTDSKGFIYHKDADTESGFGDSCQRTFMWAVAWAARYPTPFNYIEGWWSSVNKDEPRRYWREDVWPGQRGFMSRDNLFPAVCALTLANSMALKPLLVKIALRVGFLWNTKKIGQHDDAWKVPDFCGPLMWCIALRWTTLAGLYLWLPVLLHLRKPQDDTSDDLNLQVAMLTIQLLNNNKAPAVRDYYCRNRAGGWKQAIEAYFANPEAPPLDIEWIAACQKRGWL